MSGSPAVRLTRSGIRGWREAFTLVELLVVIGIIGIMAALLLPALSRSKARAQAIFCMNNSRQLALAWTLYSAENGDRLVYNLGGFQPTGGGSASGLAPKDKPNWVNNIMDWSLSQDNTNPAFVNDSNSLLAAYANYSASIFKCPADHVLSDIQKGAGWTDRVRSVSMNAMVGDAGDLMISGVNTNNPGYQQFLKESDFKYPADIFVFLDEHPDSINDGYFLNKPDDWKWYDLPAAYHNGGGSFSFADGHTEVHHWLNGSTLQPSRAYGATLPMSVRSNEAADWLWVIQRTTIDWQ
ncbi:MAG TPA: type II secretion system protein [Verrucomicrobiae bacterium]|nr:type II secretion system protein [Verrucomicrobiae bacterium]